MILRSGVFSLDNAAYSVVVLPLPVGPVTSIMPLGRCNTACTRSRICGGMPMRSSVRMPLP